MFMKILSFDIEVLPGEGGQMPNPDECPILLISVYFNKDVNLYGYSGHDVVVDNVVLLLRNHPDYESYLDDTEDESEKTVIYQFNDEKQMILQFIKLFRFFNPNIVTGYNINGFDFPYIIDRSKKLNIGGIKIGVDDSNIYYTKHLSKGLMVYKIGGLNGRILFDVLYALRREDASNTFLKKYNLKRLTLEHVSKEILGVEKLDFSAHEMIDYWNDNGNEELVSKFVNYCRRDSWLALEFVRRFRMLDRFFMLSNRSGKLPQAILNSMGSGLMVENLLLSEFKKSDRVMPCRVRIKRSDDDKELEGAFVLEPDVGIMDNIASVDYKSLYPTLMISRNLSYDTVIEDDVDIYDPNDLNEECFEPGTVFGHFIKPEIHIGIVPRLLSGLMGERAFIKKEMKKHSKDSVEYLMLDATQNAVKILLNSFYGYSGDKRAKIYSWTIASAVTSNGRKRIVKTKKQIENDIGVIEYNDIYYRLKVVASDTDSCYIKVNIDEDLNSNDVVVNTDIDKDAVMYCVKKVIGKVNETLPKPMELAFENYIKRILIVAKKRYAMLIENDNNELSITSKGIESVRRDWTDMTTETFSSVVETLLKTENIDKGVDNAIELVKKQVDALKSGDIDVNKLILTNKLTKPITSYDNKEPHVLVAIKMSERGRSFNIGDRIEYIIVDNGKTLIGDRAEEASFVISNNLKIDVDYYINNQLLKPVLRVLSLFGVNNDVMSVKLDDNQDTLHKYF